MKEGKEGEKMRKDELDGMIREVRSSAEIMVEERERGKRLNELVDGLRVCPECGGHPKGVIFGAKRRGVWIGCDRTRACMRHICIHKEGWSFEEVCEEWNRKNRWPWSWVKRVKVWAERRWGKRARWDKAREKERARANEKAEKERKRVFGDFGKGSGGVWKRVVAKVAERVRRMKGGKGEGKVKGEGLGRE